MEQILTELLQRVTRIEAKIDGYTALKDKVNCHETAIAKVEKDCHQNSKDIAEIRSWGKWLGMIIGGAVIGALLMLVIK